MNSNYFSSSQTKIRSSRKNFGRVIFLLVILSSIFSLSGVAAIYSGSHSETNEAEAFDPINWLACKFDDDSTPRVIYEISQTPIIEYQLYSKSRLGSSETDVRTGLNGILDYIKTEGKGNKSPYSFQSINENIIGQKFDGTLEKEDADKRWNKGPKVNPFDRFGVAGISFSSYRGEWSPIFLSACDENIDTVVVEDDNDEFDHGATKYYDDRKKPKTTWDNIPTSHDIRTQQFTPSFSDPFFAAISTNIANVLLFFTKIIVVFTVAFIGLAFSDISSILGITDIIAGTGPNDGLFNQLHNSIFIPLVSIAIAITGVHLFWTAIVKRQIRQGISQTLIAILCFFIAIIVSVSPRFFISLPNNIAIIGQSILASSLNEGLAGGEGLCASNLSSAKHIFGDTGGGKRLSKDVTNVKKDAGILRQASLNMQSSLGCTLWLNLLVKPWADGQFSSQYQDLYGTKGDKGKCSVSNSKSKHCIGADKKKKINRNYKWVGDPMVPLGGRKGKKMGKIEYNWALLQISTQTNAHSPILPKEERGLNSKYSQGAANDWWRIVDAFSNYDEIMLSEDACANSDNDSCEELGSVETGEYPSVMKSDVLKPWDDWTGNNLVTRVIISASSVFIAFLVVAAPLIFSAMTVVYAIGLAILMAMAPVFFLFGVWAGRGQNIFKAWLDLVINTTMKRIALGFLTILSVVLSSTILQKMDEVGYFLSILLMAVLSIALFKSRHKILNAVAFARYSTADLSGTASKLTGTLKAGGTNIGKLGTAATVGGVTSARRGGGFGGGALAGFKHQVENISRRSDFVRAGLDSAQDTQAGLRKYLGRRCDWCGKSFQPGEIIGRMYDGRVVHRRCAEMLKDYENFRELGPISGVKKDEKDTSYGKKYANKKLKTLNDADATIDERAEALTKLAQLVTNEIKEHQVSNAMNSKDVTPPPIPAEILPYVDAESLNLAWEQENYEYVKLAYTHGWISYARNETDINDNGDLNNEEALIILNTVQSSTDELWIDRDI